jgi:hypothetical protein
VLITEEGGVQLCDFGVAGINDNPNERRNTFIGTPHWMAPEIFLGNGYGTKVDVWAFGSMAYEMATGLPPNARNGFGFINLNSNPQDAAAHLKNQLPRLDSAGNYSQGLQDMVRVCLEYEPSIRPSIEEVQEHPYIYGTGSTYPTSTLSDLVRAFKVWENTGGDRKSLFGLGGVQASSAMGDSDDMSDEWNFSTTDLFDQKFIDDDHVNVFQNVYGDSVSGYDDDTTRPVAKSTRRRPPPDVLAPMKAPLEKLFDPNTITNYEDNSRTHYGMGPKTTSDLPLRDDTAQTSIRDTMIDLGGHDVATGLSSFADATTIKPRRTQNDSRDEQSDIPTGLDFSRPALSDPADNPNRRTQDWTFPSMVNPPASANPEVSRFPGPHEVLRPMVTPGSGARPALVHHPTEPISLPSISTSLMTFSPPSPSRTSMIDLDLCLVPEESRPSTSDSANSQEVTSGNPFHYENHASLYANSPYNAPPLKEREPSLYIGEGSHLGFSEFSDLSDVESGFTNGNGISSTLRESVNGNYGESVYAQSTMAPPPRPNAEQRPNPIRRFMRSHIPDLPAPPSARALSGIATDEELAIEMRSTLNSLTEQLAAFKGVYETLPTGDRRVTRDRRSETGVE